MSDFEDADFLVESWTSPGKRKRIKDAKKNKKGLKPKNSLETQEGIQKRKKKKKKKFLFKEAMEERKEKKKRKNRLMLEMVESLLFTQDSSAQAKPAASNLYQKKKLKPDSVTQDSTKKAKRKKKVEFDLSPSCIHVRRPKFASSSHKEKEVVTDAGSCSQVTAAGPGQCQQHDNDSQCNSDDINSQDLFITQKTFRASPSEHSSGEASDKAATASPPVLTEPHEGQETKLFHEESDERPHFRQHCGKSDEYTDEPKTGEQAGDGKKLHKVRKREKMLTLTQMELKANLAEENKVSCRARVRPHVVNPYLNDPIVIDSSQDVGKKNISTSSQRSSPCLTQIHESPLSTTSTLTQTENFFTTELSSYLHFCQKSRTTACSEDLKPLDLSLLHRVRKDLGSCLSAKTSLLDVKDDTEKHGDQKASMKPGQIKGGGGGRGDRGERQSASSQQRGIERKKETSGRGETTPSPESEFEPKSDATTSSEDSEFPGRTGKLDLAQVKAVQMRLNESFFFKSKGEGQSLRPESPLMKLAQGRDVKSRKSH